MSYQRDRLECKFTSFNLLGIYPKHLKGLVHEDRLQDSRTG